MLEELHSMRKAFFLLLKVLLDVRSPLLRSVGDCCLPHAILQTQSRIREASPVREKTRIG